MSPRDWSRCTPGLPLSCSLCPQHLVPSPTQGASSEFLPYLWGQCHPCINSRASGPICLRLSPLDRSAWDKGPELWVFLLSPGPFSADPGCRGNNAVVPGGGGGREPGLPQLSHLQCQARRRDWADLEAPGHSPGRAGSSVTCCWWGEEGESETGRRHRGQGPYGGGGIVAGGEGWKVKVN